MAGTSHRIKRIHGEHGRKNGSRAAKEPEPNHKSEAMIDHG